MYLDIMRNLLLTLALAALVACGKTVTSEEYLARAKNYIEASDYASATIELQNALKQDPGQAEARWLLGDLYFTGGETVAAEHEFLRAQEAGWSEDDILPALARVHLAQGEFEKVLALKYEGLSSAGAAALLSSQALAALAAEQPDRADELLKQAASKDPGSLEVTLARATMMIADENFTGALGVVDKALKLAPENDRAWRLKAQALLRLERLEEARDALDKSIELSRVAFADRVARALINLRFEDYEAARADAAVLLELYPSHPAANYVQGLLDYHDKNYLAAIKTLSLAEPIAQQYPLIYYYLGVAYQFEQDIDRSANFAKQFVALSPDSGPGWKLRAITLIQAGDAAQAHAVLRPLVAAAPNDKEALNIMANALLLDDQAYAGLVIYTRIRRLDPDWSFVPLRREAKLVTGGSGEVGGGAPGIDASGDANFPQTDILKIMEHLERKDFPAAIEAAKSYQFRHVESLSPYHVLGKIYLAAGQPENAREAFEKALKREPGDPFSRLNLAQLALQSDNPAASREHYQAILEHEPDHLGALMQLAALEARENNQKDVQKWLEQAIKAHPEALVPRLGLARYYLATGRPGSVSALFSQVDPQQRKSPGVMEVYGLALVAQERFSDAIAEFEQLVAAAPDSAKSHYLLAAAVSGAGDTERSRAELNEALRLDEKHVPSLLSLAKIAGAEGDKDALQGYLERLVELAPDSLDVIRLQASVARMNGDDDAAADHAKRAFTLAPSSQTAIDLAYLQWSAGRETEARAQLETWIAQNPGDIAVRMALANRLQEESDIPAAVAQYRAILEIQPGNPVALNNLAWSLKDTDPKRALEYIKRAVSVAPENASILDTYAVIQHVNGDNKGARSSVQKALAGDPGQPSIKYHAAMIHAALGEREKAIGILQAITAAGAAEFPERTEAAALLRKLGG